MSGIVLTVPPIASFMLPIPLSGTCVEVIAGGLEYSLDGSNWTLLPFVGPIEEAWFCNGPQLEVSSTAYTLTVRSQSNPSTIVSNSETFLVENIFPTTYFIPDDPPAPGTLGLYSQSGTLGASVQVPPFISGEINHVTAGQASFAIQQLAGTFLNASEVNFYASSNFSGDSGVFCEFTLQADYPTDGNTLITAGGAFDSGVSATGSATNLTDVVFTIAWLPTYIGNDVNGANYVAAVGWQGGLLASGNMHTPNIGEWGPGNFTTILSSGEMNQSSSVPVVQIPYSLSLNNLTGAPAEMPLALSGTNYSPLCATAIDVCYDNTVIEYNSFSARLYSAVSTFTGATVSGGAWTAELPALPVGQYTIMVRDHNLPALESNSISLAIGSIYLGPITASADVPFPLSGIDWENPVAAAMEAQISSAPGTWTPLPAFVAASATGSAWSSGPGLSVGVGTYEVQVRNSATFVLSNIQTFTIAPIPNPDDCCVPLPSGTLGRYRGAVGINFYGQTLIGDAWSGVIGAANFSSFQEYGNTMRGLIASPPLHNDRKRVFVSRFEIDVESGVGQPDCCGSNPQWMLDWSKDGGRTWGPIQQFRSMGRIGQYMQRLRWLRLGQSRQWIFRLQSTDPVRRAIIGTYADFYAGMGATGQ